MPIPTTRGPLTATNINSIHSQFRIPNFSIFTVPDRLHFVSNRLVNHSDLAYFGSSNIHSHSHSFAQLPQSLSLAGSLTFDLLSQACFMLSNNMNIGAPLLKSLLDWIAVSAELGVLKSLFSIKSCTAMAVWENLLRTAKELRRLDAFDILIEAGISLNRGQ
jgi:hypothetical protein